MPSLLTTTNDVSRIAIAGTNIGVMQTSHHSCFPAKSRRANAYAAMEFTTRLATVKMTAPTKVMTMARTNAGSARIRR